jgi:hypothetical protein
MAAVRDVRRPMNRMRLADRGRKTTTRSPSCNASGSLRYSAMHSVRYFPRGAALALRPSCTRSASASLRLTWSSPPIHNSNGPLGRKVGSALYGGGGMSTGIASAHCSQASSTCSPSSARLRTKARTSDTRLDRSIPQHPQWCVRSGRAGGQVGRADVGGASNNDDIGGYSLVAEDGGPGVVPLPSSSHADGSGGNGVGATVDHDDVAVNQWEMVGCVGTDVCDGSCHAPANPGHVLHRRQHVDAPQEDHGCIVT